MPSKTEEYLTLAQRTANGLTRYWESWTDYLTTASRLYKYPFADQLMIYAQRPDATACADFDIWNNRMNRYVRRGAKGIALLDESSGFPRLHYVFDVSDTGCLLYTSLPGFLDKKSERTSVLQTLKEKCDACLLYTSYRTHLKERRRYAAYISCYAKCVILHKHIFVFSHKSIMKTLVVY